MPAAAVRRGCAAVAVLAAAAVAALAVAVPRSPALRSGDARVSIAAVGFGRHHRGWTTSMWWVTQLGGTIAAVAVCGLLAVLLARSVRRGRLTARRGWYAAGYALVAVLVPGGLVEGVKHLVRRPRPAPPDPLGHFAGFSFPSGHAAHVAAEVLVVSVVLLRVSAGHCPGGRSGRGGRIGRRGALAVALAVALAGVALAVGGSRVALGAHYPTDVLAGWALGAAWVATLTAVRPP